MLLFIQLPPVWPCESMNDSIDLLKRAQTPQTLKKRIKSILNVVSLISLLILVVTSLSLIAANYFLVSRIKEVNQRIKTQELKINSLAEIEVMQWAISDKLTALKKILEAELPFDERIRELEKVLPVEVSLAQVTLGETTFSVSVNSPKLSALNQLIGNLISPELGGKHFRKVVLEGLSIDDKGMYRMGISGEVL